MLKQNIKLYLLFLLLIGNHHQNSFAQNIMVGSSGSPNEPSIMMDPENPNILVAGSNLNHYYRSLDSGEHWTEHILTSSYGVWGDPVINIDTNGDFYFFHLSNIPSSKYDRIVCQKSSDNGLSWSDGTYAGLNGTKDQDKQWSIIDRSNNNIYLVWTQFDKYGSSDPLDVSIVLFSKSLDRGGTWSTPVQINEFSGSCVEADGTSTIGAVPAVGPNGEIYVSWTGPNGLVFNKSLDQGETWLTEEVTIHSLPDGNILNIPGIYRAYVMPAITCDISGGVNSGTIYVNWTDQLNGADDLDVWLSKSTDGGNTWSSPTKVNNDNSNMEQFFPWMDIDQTNGNLHFIFYDRRNHTNQFTDVFLAHSDDGGETFSNRKISETPFYPNSAIFFGDYNNITVHDNIVRPIWTRLHENKLSIWTDITAFDASLSINDEIIQDLKQYPNPVANNISYVSFKLHEESVVRLEIFNPNGKLTHNIIDDDTMQYGKYIIPINLNDLNIQSGIYFYKLSINGVSKTLKYIVVD